MRPNMSGQRGLTLPLVLVMAAIALVAISSTTFLAGHFRSTTIAQDADRIYYALDAAVGAVMADLVRGADPLDESYRPPDVSVNNLAAVVEIIAPGSRATPTSSPQYFDTGVGHPT